MYRFLLRPKWIAFHVLVLAAVVGMLTAANWQWGKYGARTDFVDKVELRQSSDLLDLTTAVATMTAGDIEYNRLTATGRYLDTDPYVEILQSRGGVNGVNVVSLFQVDGGPTVVVNRGFVADGVDLPPTPTGELLIGGTARTSEQRRTGQLTDNDSGRPRELRRIDLDVIAERAGTDVAPIYLDLIRTEPPEATPPERPPAPDLSGGPPYLSYSIQWCIFSVAVIVGWVFAVRRSKRNRARAASKAAAASDGASLSVDGPGAPSA